MQNYVPKLEHTLKLCMYTYIGMFAHRSYLFMHCTYSVIPYCFVEKRKFIQKIHLIVIPWPVFANFVSVHFGIFDEFLILLHPLTEIYRMLLYNSMKTFQTPIDSCFYYSSEHLIYIRIDYIPRWLLKDSGSCGSGNGFLPLEVMKLCGAGCRSNFPISLFIDCSEFIVCDQFIVGNRGTGRKTCCHLSGAIWSLWYSSLFINLSNKQTLCNSFSYL